MSMAATFIRAHKKLLVAAGLLLLAAAFLVPLTIANNAAVGVLPNDVTAPGTDNSGTPVGPPRKIIMCHDGQTVWVDERQVPYDLEHGYTLGPCNQKVVICLKGDTLIIDLANLPGYLKQGATLGPCPNKVFMCNNLDHIIVCDASEVNDHLARGQRLGLCDGFKLVCYKGRSIVVTDKEAENYLNDGGYLGFCLGSQGPIISTNALPKQSLK
jgi:hypothetical protein